MTSQTSTLDTAYEAPSIAVLDCVFDATLKGSGERDGFGRAAVAGPPPGWSNGGGPPHSTPPGQGKKP